MRDLQVIDRPPATPTRAGALDRLTRAICVVSASSDGIPHAATIDSFTFVSTEPAVAMVSLTTGSLMLDFIERAGAFAVSLLAFDQEVLARRFASRSRGLGWAQFDGVGMSLGRWTNAPLLRGALASYELEVGFTVAAGDHVMILGGLLEAKVSDSDTPPLLRQGRAYRTL